MKKREPLMSAEYFATYQSFTRSLISEIDSELANPPSASYKTNLAYLDLYNNWFKLINLAYSSGDSIGDLKPVLLKCIEALKNYKNHLKAKPVFFNKEVDEYMNVVALLTWSVTLDVDSSVFEDLVNHIDAEGQRDALIDTIIAARHPQRVISSTLYFPKLYTNLYEATQERSASRITQFLTGWYKNCLSRTAQVDIHTLHGGDDSGFMGYWAWEIAGLTIALGIDDSAYRHMPYYPADLTAFARDK
jgi:hypothetical protein